ncbi:UTRA domain-containing protein [Thalassotalea atypica]|uniref:UTRA domain-containing protein n=1 Tax=Thalassotalea atypica TaxID=2054316 RepID=UPI0025742F9D|nr:UTRA domain-containing protein [Thalassotalea atypica]
MNQPKYKVIANTLSDKIRSTEWEEGFKIPSEIELATQFSASRMTARKAVDELVLEGLLKRVPSVGTFVSFIQAQSSILEIKNISDEIKARGHKHRMMVLSKLSFEPTGESAFPFNSHVTKVFKVIVIHYENNTPIQLEERYVNADRVPLFLEQDFSKITVNEYLSSISPLTEAEISVEAMMPTQILKHNLKLNDSVPCLKVTRTTISSGYPISYAVLYHPADKFKLTTTINTNNHLRA